MEVCLAGVGINKMAAQVEQSHESPPPIGEDEEQERKESEEEDEVKSKEPEDSAKAIREERMRKLRDLHKRRVSNNYW